MSNSPAASHRFGFIDQLRGWAVIVMIEVHVFNEWLRPELKALGSWEIVTFLNGLVAPTFISLAGVSIALAAWRKWDQYTRPSRALLPRFRHLGLILAIGYLLHLPARTYRDVLDGIDPAKLSDFFAVDVLQLIVVSLLLVHGVLFLRPGRAAFRTIMLGSGLLVFAITPLMYQAGTISALPVWLAAYLNKAHGSLFPLFPWSGFVFLGAGVGMRFMEAREHGIESAFMRRLPLIGAALIVIGVVGQLLPEHMQNAYEFWRATFNLIRFGSVLLLFSLLRWLELRFESQPSFPRLMGQESLFVYALHLVLLFGVFNGTSLASMYNGTLRYLESGFGYVVFLAVMGLAALGWHALKTTSPRTARAAITATAVIALSLFFFIL